MGRPATGTTSFDNYLAAMAPKLYVDSRIPLRNYYRIANNLLKQADIYRKENNLIDLFLVLLRYSSLVFDTIPSHQDYQTSFSNERTACKKKLPIVIKELETLKPKIRRQVEKLCIQEKADPHVSTSSSLKRPVADDRALSSYNNQRMEQSPTNNSFGASDSINKQFQKLSVSLPLPKEETLSRHSILGPNGLRGQWLGPSSEIKVYYPTNNTDFATIGSTSLIQVGQENPLSKDDVSAPCTSAMNSVLSLDDGRWSSKDEDLGHAFQTMSTYDDFPLIKQPSPPPVLARVQPEHRPISPSRVADPRPGPAQSSPDGAPSSNTYQNLHIPIKMMDDFLRLAKENTARNLETCGVLAGSLKNRVYHLTTLIVPKQESTSDSCQTLNEEEIFEVQDKLSLFPLGWIHTHPSQTCFMSSVDLHTHYSYQVMLPEAIAIVMAPTDTSSPHGIFHLSDPGGVSVIKKCQQRGFHPHEEPDDGSSIYEHCSHVYLNPNLKFNVVDLR